MAAAGQNRLTVVTGCEASDVDVLQDAEDYFLACVGHTGGSPYLFGLSADAGRAEDGQE